MLFRSGEAVYVFNGQIVQGKAVGKLPNPSAKWEVAEKLDVGFDFNTLNNRLSLVFDYFIEKRNDLLISNFPVSGIIGTAAPGASNPTVNAGNTQNKGFEVALGYKSDVTKPFSWGLRSAYSVFSLSSTSLPSSPSTLISSPRD